MKLNQAIGERLSELLREKSMTRFSSPDKVLAYAGLSPSTYQSGKLENVHAHMEKHGSP